jgi:hypothetical protein
VQSSRGDDQVALLEGRQHCFVLLLAPYPSLTTDGASASSDPASIQLDLQGAGSSHPRRYACVEAGNDRRPPNTGQSEPGGLSADSLVQKTGQGGVLFYRVTAGLAITPDTREHVSGLTASR